MFLLGVPSNSKITNLFADKVEFMQVNFYLESSQALSFVDATAQCYVLVKHVVFYQESSSFCTLRHCAAYHPKQIGVNYDACLVVGFQSVK